MKGAAPARRPPWRPPPAEPATAAGEIACAAVAGAEEMEERRTLGFGRPAEEVLILRLSLVAVG
jgi:hypothetical protein